MRWIIDKVLGFKYKTSTCESERKRVMTMSGRVYNSQIGVHITDIGVEAALIKLLPFVRAAGQIAHLIQPQIQATKREEKGGSLFASALTATDLLIEDRLGGDILRLFKDVSFYGEEFKLDNISRFFPKNAPYIVTLDPINSTAYYHHGLPQYEVIITICDMWLNMLGSLVYLPASDRGFIGLKRDRFGMDRALRFTVKEGAKQPIFRMTRFHLPSGAPRSVYLDEAYTCREDMVRKAGYTAVFPWRDFKGESDWLHASHGILTGLCRGIVNPDAQLIDSAAFGFIVKCAGGIWMAGKSFDLETKRYSYGMSAADKETADLLMEVINY